MVVMAVVVVVEGGMAVMRIVIVLLLLEVWAGVLFKVVVVVALLLLGSQFIHGTYKLPQKTMRVHIARCTQYIHVRSHELKLPMICIPLKYTIAPLSTHTQHKKCKYKQ